MPDIIDLVIQDHHEVALLFERLQAAKDVSERSELFNEVKGELTRHATAEERVLYPRVKKEVPDGKEETTGATEEHDQIRASLKEVEEHDPASDLFVLAVAQLIATTKHHVGVEEEELLPNFQKNSDLSEREELGRLFTEEKAKVKVD